MCMTMTYQLWHWQYEWYISRGLWFVDCDEDFRYIHKYILVFALFNFDLVLSVLKINAAWLLFIMLICAKIVENTVYTFISNVKTTSIRIRYKQRRIPTLCENNPFNT